MNSMAREPGFTTARRSVGSAASRSSSTVAVRKPSFSPRSMASTWWPASLGRVCSKS